MSCIQLLINLLHIAHKQFTYISFLPAVTPTYLYAIVGVIVALVVVFMIVAGVTVYCYYRKNKVVIKVGSSGGSLWQNDKCL